MADYKFDVWDKLNAGLTVSNIGTDDGSAVLIYTDVNLYLALFETTFAQATYGALTNMGSGTGGNLAFTNNLYAGTNYSNLHIGSGTSFAFTSLYDSTNHWLDLDIATDPFWNNLGTSGDNVQSVILYRNQASSTVGSNAIPLFHWDVSAQPDPNGSKYSLVLNTEGLLRLGGAA